MPEEYALWKVAVVGSSSIHLYPKEPFGDSFVYHRTKRHACEVCEHRIHSRWGAPSGTHVQIPHSITVEQAREIRQRVLKDVQDRARELAAESTLDRVCRALTGEIG